MKELTCHGMINILGTWWTYQQMGNGTVFFDYSDIIVSCIVKDSQFKDVGQQDRLLMVSQTSRSGA